MVCVHISLKYKKLESNVIFPSPVSEGVSYHFYLWIDRLTPPAKIESSTNAMIEYLMPVLSVFLRHQIRLL